MKAPIVVPILFEIPTGSFTLTLSVTENFRVGEPLYLIPLSVLKQALIEQTELTLEVIKANLYIIEDAEGGVATFRLTGTASFTDGLSNVGATFVPHQMHIVELPPAKKGKK